MNILVIGNGFDWAHGLPTRYTDFLDFVESFENIINSELIMASGGLLNTTKTKYKYLDWLIFSEASLSKEFGELIDSNIWVEYFLSNSKYARDGWIDFECEISKVIKSLDNDLYNQRGIDSIEETVTGVSNNF